HGCGADEESTRAAGGGRAECPAEAPRRAAVTQQAGGSEPFGPRDPAAPGGAAASGPKAPGMLGGLPDSGQGKFLLRLTPKSWHPYIELARLDRPTGWWLLLLPCWWSSALASLTQGAPLNLRDLALFFAGAVVMRGAGSTYNDIVDRDLDTQVTRTRPR